MAIYIKGMEMPKDCDRCRIGDIIGCELWKPMDVNERHPYCPLTEVHEPHGRLIDADWFFNTFAELASYNWIPVSDRLPKIGQKVLASTKRTVFTQVFKGFYSEPNVWHWEHNTIKKVTAWMPLPEPYESEVEA